MDPFLGQINLLGCNFAPLGWAFCQGQILSIAQYSALFSLLGITYGGNGVSNFALPDLRSRAPIGFGQGPGLSNYALGDAGGVETVADRPDDLPEPFARALGRRQHRHRECAGRSDRGRRADRRPRRRGQSRPVQLIRQRHHPGAGRVDRRGRRQPAAHQPSALSRAELLHRLAGYFPVEELRRERGLGESASRPFSKER